MISPGTLSRARSWSAAPRPAPSCSAGCLPPTGSGPFGDRREALAPDRIGQPCVEPRTGDLYKPSNPWRIFREAFAPQSAAVNPRARSIAQITNHRRSVRALNALISPRSLWLLRTNHNVNAYLHKGLPDFVQSSILSASASASSTSTPRYRTVLSIFVRPSRS